MKCPKSLQQCNSTIITCVANYIHTRKCPCTVTKVKNLNSVHAFYIKAYPWRKHLTVVEQKKNTKQKKRNEKLLQYCCTYEFGNTEKRTAKVYEL